MQTKQPPRIVYAAGPGNVLGTYMNWRVGREDPTEVAVTYSGQFFKVCAECNAQAYVIASSTIPGYLRDGRFTIVHRPIQLNNRGGALYHLGQVWYAVRMILTILWFRADMFVSFNGSGYWFVYRVLPWFGVKVVPSMHCTMWSLADPPRGVRKLIAQLNRKFFSKSVAATMSASREISKQIHELTGGQEKKLFEFLPLYNPQDFTPVVPPPVERNPFRVLFAGRIVENKGVFELLDIAKRFAALGRTDIEFDLCGDGPALANLRKAASDAGLESRFRCQGRCNRPRMREMFSAAHVVIVPTTSDFIEGFNQVVAEGVLSGRPVVTSAVCPALDYVRSAVVEVPVDDVQAYGDALLKLCDDREFYEAKAAACRDLQPQFFDTNLAWEGTLRKVLHFVAGEAVPEPAGALDKSEQASRSSIGSLTEANAVPGTA